jgi:hypothetical protein
MAAQSEVTSVEHASALAPEASRIYAEGLVAGLIGAAAIALWFLIVDTLRGHPMYTPNVLGTALFRGGTGLENPAALPVDFEVVLSFTWVHVLAFLVIGALAARLVALAERDANFGFGVLLLFVFFEFGFVVASMVFAEPVLRAIAWPEVLLGNLIAAAAMAATFWRRHPSLQIAP